jgi:hypothetical protein
MPPRSTLSASEKRAFAFARRVRKQAAAIVGAAVPQVAVEDKTDPKLYGLVLLCRSISNFQGALAMARHDQAVECLTLVTNADLSVSAKWHRALKRTLLPHMVDGCRP